jgi:hypothetical protein
MGMGKMKRAGRYDPSGSIAVFAVLLIPAGLAAAIVHPIGTILIPISVTLIACMTGRNQRNDK